MASLTLPIGVLRNGCEMSLWKLERLGCEEIRAPRKL